MKAKDYLNQYRIANDKAERLRLEYEKEQETINAIKSSLNIDGAPHGLRISRSVEDIALQLADKFASWKMAEMDALQVRQEVFDNIYHIQNIEGDVLYLRYIDLAEWEDIADALNYSLSGVFRAHQRALAIVDKKINKSHHG